jgi:hypothetical protein
LNVSSVADLGSEEQKEEERPHDDNVNPNVTSGDDEEESPVDVENGTGVVVKGSIFSSVIPEESSLQDEDEVDEKVPVENGHGEVAR